MKDETNRGRGQQDDVMPLSEVDRLTKAAMERIKRDMDSEDSGDDDSAHRRRLTLGYEGQFAHRHRSGR